MLHDAPEIRGPLPCCCRRVLSSQAVRQTSSCFLLYRFTQFVDFPCFIMGTECVQRHGKERLPYGHRPPSQKMFDCRPADAALAWPHAATRLQLRVGPAGMAAQAVVSDILATA